MKEGFKTVQMKSFPFKDYTYFFYFLSIGAIVGGWSLPHVARRLPHGPRRLADCWGPTLSRTLHVLRLDWHWKVKAFLRDYSQASRS